VRLPPWRIFRGGAFSEETVIEQQWCRRVSQKPCNFWGIKAARFLIGLNDAHKKMQFSGTIKKLASLILWRQNAKWQKTSAESTVTGPIYV